MTRAHNFLGILSLAGSALLIEGCMGNYRELDELVPTADRLASVIEIDAGYAQPVQLQPMPEPSVSGRGAPGVTAPGRAGATDPRFDDDAGPPAADGGVDHGSVGSGGMGGSTGSAGRMPTTPKQPGAAGSAGAANSGGAGAAAGSGGSSSKPIALPPVGVGFDYQVGAVYPPPAAAEIVSRDHTQAPVANRYNICEMSGFRVREQDRDAWLDLHPDLVVRDTLGVPLVDKYSSMLLDVSTDAKRSELTTILTAWIESCANAGFDAVAINDLDAYAESNDQLEARDVVETMKALAQIAHKHRLAIAQKNASELAAQKDAMGTDFAVAEECNRYHECETYRTTYGDRVLVLEYRRSDFEAGCSDYPQLPTVLRDSTLVDPTDERYVYDGC